MLSKVSRSFQSLFVGNNDNKSKSERKRLRDDSDDDPDLTGGHAKRPKLVKDGPKEPSIFGSVAEYLVRASRKSFSENSFIQRIVRQASPHRIMDRIATFTPTLLSHTNRTDANRQTAQSSSLQPPDSYSGIDQYRTWASTPTSITVTHQQQDPRFKVPTKPQNRIGMDARYVRTPVSREPQRLAPLSNNNSMSFNGGPRHVGPVGRSVTFQPMYNKLYPGQGVLNSQRSQNNTAAHARTQLAAKMSWRLDEKNRYAQLLQQLTTVPLQPISSSASHLRQKKVPIPSSRKKDCTVLGTSIPKMSSTESLEPHTDFWTVQDVSPRPRSSSPEVTSRVSLNRQNSYHLLRHHSVDSLHSSDNASIRSGVQDTEPFPRKSSDRTKADKSSDDSIVIIHDSSSSTSRSGTSPVSLRSPVVEEFQQSLQNCRYNEDWLKNLTTNRKEAIRKCGHIRRAEEENLKYLQEQRTEWEQQLEERMRHKLKLSARTPVVEEYEYIESEEEEELLDEFLELTDEQEDIIDDALRRQPAGQVLSEGFRLMIRRSDMETLRGLNWLNDEIVNFYFELIRERGKLDNMPSVHVFNTFFYPKVKSQGQQGVRRWTKSADIFSFDYIAIPIHLGMHWCLAVIDFGKKAVRYFDSMGGKNMECLSILSKYLNDEHKQKKGSPYDLSDWTQDSVTGIPQQMNGSDCGVFTCKFADYITRNKELTFTQENMPYFRRRMVYEIVTKELLS